MIPRLADPSDDLGRAKAAQDLVEKRYCLAKTKMNARVRCVHTYNPNTKRMTEAGGSP